MSSATLASLSRSSRAALAAAKPLSLKLLGGASVERDGAPIAGRAGRGHRLALLALLARGRPLSRDKALALLWPECDAERGRRMLSDTLYLLRSAFGDDVVPGAGEELRLTSERISADVAEFERLLDAGELEEAVRLYAGPFLDGFHLADSTEFEEWAEAERARLGRRYAEALEGLAVASEGARAWTAAVGWWRRLATLEPANGRVALRLMLALEAAGDRAGALQHARVHAAILKGEYDSEPDPEIIALLDRLKGEPAVRGEGDHGGHAPLRFAQGDTPSHRGDTFSSVSPRRRAIPGTALLGLVLAAMTIAVYRPEAPEPTPAPPPVARQSIAVLPFENLSPDRERDYFSAGLTEELIGTLSRIRGLRVAARGSSFAVAAGRLDVRTIGDTLGVATVLEGSVRQEGRRLRVGARLIDAATGFQIWSQVYDRELEDVFAVQDEIARAIVGALEIELGGSRVEARRTPSLEAHDLYLRGVYVRNQLTQEGLTRAVDFFDRAIQLDSGYALAYAGKATALGPMIWYGYLPREQGLPDMREAASRSLALDSTLGEAHAAQALIEFYFDWNWPAAEREFLRAIELNPSDPHAHHMFANYLTAMGRFEEGIAERQRALELDPLSIRSGTLLGRDYFTAGQYARAVQQLRLMAEMDSTSPLALGVGQEGSFGLGDVYERLGRHDEALAEYLKIARLEGIPLQARERLERAYAEGGMPAFWRERLNVELSTPGPRHPLRIASLWARIGDAERTADWLEQAWRERSMALVFLNVLPLYDEVRSHPRVAELIRRMRLETAPGGRAYGLHDLSHAGARGRRTATVR